VVQILATGYVPVHGTSTTVLAKERSSGSGIIVEENGFIITSAPVVVQAENRGRLRHIVFELE